MSLIHHTDHLTYWREYFPSVCFICHIFEKETSLWKSKVMCERLFEYFVTL